MDKDTELTAFLLRYLFENGYFKTKDEMARAFGISKRQLQRLINAPESSKGGSIALSKILNYFGVREIPFDSVLATYLGKNMRITPVTEKAYMRLHISMPVGLSMEGEQAFTYCRDFLCLLSLYVCPNCPYWCDPWDGREKLRHRNCFVAQTEKAMEESIVANYAQGSENP